MLGASAPLSPLDLLNKTDWLYHGYLDTNIMARMFWRKRDAMIQQLIDLDQTLMARPDLEQSIDFHMSLFHTALNETWKWPVLLHQRDTLYWSSGSSRVLASGICHDRPWKMSALLVSNPSQVSSVLHDAKHITCDQTLFEILGSTPLEMEQHETHWFLMRCGDWIQPNPGWCLQQWRKWRAEWPNPSLEIHAAKPHLIRDSLGAWKCGPGGKFKIVVHEEININLGELLFWMRPGVGTYQDRLDRFTLYSPDPGESVKISISALQ